MFRINARAERLAVQRLELSTKDGSQVRITVSAAGETAGMTTGIPDSLRDLARLQGGVVSSQQALAAGMTKAALVWRLRSGRWQQLHHGVYLLSSGSPVREATLWAAVLRSGPDAMLSFQTAAELAHLIDQPSNLVHVTLPTSRRLRPVSGLVIHVSRRADRIRHPSLLPPRTRIEDTVLDLVGVAASFDEACDWVTRACGRRLTTPDKLRTAMAARGRQRWRDLLGPLLAHGDGLHSVLEFRYHRDVERAHCLPRATRQERAARGQRIQYRDASYRQYQVVVELDGRVAHRDDTRWRDIRRDNAAAADGSLTLRYGWSDVTARPCRTAGEVARVLIRRGWAGSPKLCSPGCSVVSGWV
jgi:very-short-patch-repair endonuclease